MRFVISCEEVDTSRLLRGTRRFPCVRTDVDSAPLTPRARAVLQGHMPTLNISDLPTRGAIGCALSHITLWKKLVHSGADAMVVFEDDAELTRSPEEIEVILERARAHPYDVFFLGLRFPLETILEQRTTPADDEFRWVHSHFWETHAYVIRKPAARALLKHALPIDVQIDAYMCAQAKSQNLRYLCHNATLARQRRSIFDSSVQASIWTQCAPCRLPPPLRSGIFAGILAVILVALLVVFILWCRR